MVLEDLKSWQGGIGSLLGLLAILIGALYNFHLNRKRDEKIRSDEANSVAAALYGEILLLRIELAQVACAVSYTFVNFGTGKSQKNFDSDFLEANTISDPILYMALAPKFGLLDTSLLIPIAKFYSNLQQAKKWLPLLVDKEDRGFSYGPLYVLVPVRDAVEKIESTLMTIERKLSIKPSDKTIDLGLTSEVIQMEDW
jgi:hypothetical protein